MGTCNRKYLSILFLSVLFFVISLSFKDSVYAKTDSSGIPLANNSHGIAINPFTDIAVSTNEKSDSVSVIELKTEKVISTISVGKAPVGVAIDKSLNKAVIGNSKDNTISIIDLEMYKVTSTITVGKEPNGIAIDTFSHRAFVANHKDNTVSVIDLMTYKMVSVIPVGREPIDVAVDQDLELVVVVNEKDYTLSVIDLSTNKTTGTFSLGKKPLAIDINPETHLAGVANEKDNSVTVIDLQSWETITIAVGKHPVDIAINPLDNRALIVCDEERSLVYVDLDIRSIINTYSLNKLPRGVAVNPFTNAAAVVDDRTDSLTLIQLPNPVSVITSIAPDNALRGSDKITMHIEGNKFMRGTTVSLKSPAMNYELSAIFTDNHHIEATVPEELLSKAGSFSVNVTNPQPEGGTSNSIVFTVNNPVPSITTIDPAEAMAGTPGLLIDIYGTGFFDDTAFYVNSTQRPFSLNSQTYILGGLSAEDLEAGAYLYIAASNPSPGGGLSPASRFTVLNPVPALTSINPTSTTAGSPDLTMTLAGDNFVKTSIVIFNNQQYTPIYIDRTLLKITIPSDAIRTPGTYNVKVINPSPGGGESSSILLTVKPPLEIKITSPADGETINRAKTMVKGTIKSDTKDVGITVNGMLAEINGNEWIANGIPLTIGLNSIEAVATDSYGNTDTKTITVYTNDTIQPVELTSNITSGIAPLEVYFSISTNTEYPVTTYQIDYEGDGVIDYSGETFEDITYTYTSEGIFYPTITITDDQGNTFSDTIAITVMNKDEIDALLKVKWEGMKTSLAKEDISSALSYFGESTKNDYKEMFTALVSVLPIISQEMNDVELINIIENTAEYDIRTIRNGEEYSFYLLFVKDGNGIWKIRSF